MSNRVDEIRAALETTLTPTHLSIEDESWKHAGHAGAKEQGGGHYHITIVSSRFDSISRMARHRMVHQSLARLFGPTIHAITIRAFAPDEADTTDLT